MAIRRLILGALVIVLFGAGLSLLLLVSSLDRVVEFAIETYGSQIVGTSVQVDSVEIGLRDGEGTIRGLHVANPDGFGPDDAIQLERITLGLDVASLRSGGPIVVDVLDVAAPVVRLVVDGRGRSNLKAIEQNAAAYGGDAPPESANDEAAAPTLLKIRRFAVERGSVAADLSVLGHAGVKVPIPELQLRDVGGRDGATPGEIGATLAAAFVESALEAIASSSIQEGIDGLVAGALGGSKRAARAADDAKQLLRGFLQKPASEGAKEK